MLSGQRKLLEDTPKDISECLEGMGKDTLPTLNVCESKYLNFYFLKDKKTFDFFDKRIIFLQGNTGTIKSTKKEYFDRLKQFVDQKGFFPESGIGQLIIFNEDEVKKLRYDAVIISLSKKYLTKKDVFKRWEKRR